MTTDDREQLGGVTRRGPTWDDDVRLLFAEPFWIDADRRAATGAGWISAMKGYFVELDQIGSVRSWAAQIYAHLHSRAMPLTADVREQWPDEALETLRRWANEGFRESSAAPFDEAERIPRPALRPLQLRVRKDLTKMSTAELDEYRARLDDLQIASAAPDAPWQTIGSFHTNWCLHYQEAFLFWHRANLLWLEQRIGMAIPYWNWMSPHVAERGHPAAGLPRAFLDETYVHPRTREVRPNPLRYASAFQGKSKACVRDATLAPGCKWVHRDPLLVEESSDPSQLQDKLDQLLTYQDQVRNAFRLERFSTPQGWPGYPWANIPTFPAPDAEYPYLNETFDGTYEQPHDNFHGWVGPDMADNTYTAFDPVFWSHHSMIDLVFELWLREHPAATYTATFPLRPFLGADAASVDETESRAFLYTTIGDMARDARRLGYDFADLPAIREQLRSTTEGPRLNALFEGVRCTLGSYALDLYLNPPTGELRATSDNPHFALRMTRLGMGSQDQNDRCIKHGVQRLVDLTRAARRLGLGPADPCRLVLVVTELATGRVVPSEECARLPGFTPRLLWRGSAGATEVVFARGEAPSSPATEASPCCATKGGAADSDT